MNNLHSDSGTTPATQRISVLVLLLAISLISVIGFSACGNTLFKRTPVPNLTPSPFPEEVDGCPIRPGTDCPGVDMTGVDLGATRVGRDFIRKGANLRDSNFEGGNFIGTRMFRIHLESANMSNTDLTHADISSASLYQADFSGANLTNANLELSDIDEVSFEGAIFCNTKWTDGTTRNDDCPTP